MKIAHGYKVPNFLAHEYICAERTIPCTILNILQPRSMNTMTSFVSIYMHIVATLDSLLDTVCNLMAHEARNPAQGTDTRLICRACLLSANRTCCMLLHKHTAASPDMRGCIDCSTTTIHSHAFQLTI